MPPVTRRSFLKSTSAGTAALAAAASTASVAKGANPPVSEQEQFLLDRITFGRSPDMVAEIQARGYQGFLDWQLDSDELDDGALFDEPSSAHPNGGRAFQECKLVSHAFRLSPFEIVTDTSIPDPNNPPGVGSTYPAPSGGRMLVDAPRCFMMGGEFGQHQLRWVMTDFFQNVHNTLLNQPKSYPFWPNFVRTTIFDNALGNYRDLCLASAKGASMMQYLGQPFSNQSEPNENYARELAELHTVGVKKYTLFGFPIETFIEDDIDDFAKILTGIDMIGAGLLLNPPQVSGPPITSAFGDYTYDINKHAGGTKTVSMTGGAFPTYTPKTYPNTGSNGLGPGEGEADELIRDLVAYPGCALYISKRLVQWFLGDNYETDFFDVWIRTASTFQSTGGDIRETIRELFNPNFWHQLKPAGQRDLKVRRPMNKVIAFKRALNAYEDHDDPGGALWLSQQLEMGQVPGYWPAPNGYQPENEKWTTTMQPMLRFYFDAIWGTFGPDPSAPIAGNGLRVPDSTLLTLFPDSAPLCEYGQLAADAIAGGQIDAQEIAAINSVIAALTGPGDPRRWALFYTLTSPSYQFLS